MRRIPWLLPLLLLTLSAPSARAAEPKCPLDLATCLQQFDNLRHRPWLGVEVDADSTGQRIIKSVVPGGPAARAGMKPGDRLERIDGTDPGEWFAGKAGWKDVPTTEVKVDRRGRTVTLAMKNQHIPEDLLARIIGVHMLEGHLAYAHEDETSHQ